MIAYDEGGVVVWLGDCRDVLATLPDASVQTVVTSPPYYGLRDYGVDGQIGLEPTVDAYVAEMVSVFREVRRVLADNGTLWLNLGDSYAAGSTGRNDAGRNLGGGGNREGSGNPGGGQARPVTVGLKHKDLIGIPWRVAFALQADGWILRQDIIWAKPNPMPESVTDRCTKSHEYLFLLSKGPRYYFDAAAIAEMATWDRQRSKMPDGWDTGPGGHGSFHRNGRERGAPASHSGSRFDAGKTADHQLGRAQQGTRFGGRKYGDSDVDQDRTKSGNLYDGLERRNRRDVWTIEATGNRDRECLAIITSDLAPADKLDAIKAMMGGAQSSVWRIAPKPFTDAHFATFPPKLVEPCILSGSRPGDVVLDPFAGSGTTLQVSKHLGRRAVGIELNPEYLPMIERRLQQAVLPLGDAA